MLFLYNLILTLFFIFLFYYIFYSLHCPLSGPDLTYISLLIIPCIIYHVTNKETLNLDLVQVSLSLSRAPPPDGAPALSLVLLLQMALQQIHPLFKSLSLSPSCSSYDGMNQNSHSSHTHQSRDDQSENSFSIITEQT